MIEKISISKIFSNPVNPRLIKDHKFNQLVKSIKEFPEMLKLRPIIVNEEYGILGGNMRYKACKELGMEEVWIIKADNLNDKQIEQFVIKDNIGFGEWDWDILANTWEPQELKEWGLEGFPFDLDDKEEEEIQDTGDYDFPEDQLENSHVKMVQLFLSTITEPEFKKWELALRKSLSTDNLTDTVFKVMKDAYEKIS